MTSKISRRDFLKLSASGALGLVLSDLGVGHALASPPASQGRVIWSGVPLYDAPSFKAKELLLFGTDQIVEIKAEVECRIYLLERHVHVADQLQPAVFSRHGLDPVGPCPM